MSHGWTIKEMFSKKKQQVYEEYAPATMSQDTVSYLTSLDMMSGQVCIKTADLLLVGLCVCVCFFFFSLSGWHATATGVLMFVVMSSIERNSHEAVSFICVFCQEDRENILRARASGKGALTNPFRLLESKHLGVVFTFAVYSIHLHPDATPDERIKATAGFSAFKTLPHLSLPPKKISIPRTAPTSEFESLTIFFLILKWEQ
jgi:hypothetical protein